MVTLLVISTWDNGLSKLNLKCKTSTFEREKHNKHVHIGRGYDVVLCNMLQTNKRIKKERTRALSFLRFNRCRGLAVANSDLQKATTLP